MAAPLVLRVVEAQAIGYKRLWRASLFSTFISPVLYLAAMGLGLGAMVDRNLDPSSLGGADSYLAFIAPGLLAAQAMQLGFGEASWPVMAGIKWTKGYHGMLATPIGASDIAVGLVAWVGVRLFMASAVFALVMAAFGAVESVGVLLAIPAAVLTGLAFAAPLAAFTASLENESGLASMMRFGIVPMFLFSGTFFPIEQLPNWLEVVAYVTPLWHGVALCRSLSLGTATFAGSALHVGYLALWTLVGTIVAIRRFQKRLVV
jgi:lipooligosaccharide transport system permease protein